MCDLCGLDACLLRSENFGEFRIRGLQIGLYLRNISNENLGDRYYRGWLKTNNKQGYLFLSKMAKVSIQFSDPG